MIVCPTCLHHNLDEASYCEACGVHLPDTQSCNNCGTPVSSSARFCGQCGFNLQLNAYHRVEGVDGKGTNSEVLLPEPFPPEPILNLNAPITPLETPTPTGETSVNADSAPYPDPAEPVDSEHEWSDDETPNTQIQNQSVILLHVQSSTLIRLPLTQKVIHIGKPNDRVPPDINVSVFSSAEVVSRVHAALHNDNGDFFVEDVGSANGTYLNNMPLTPNSRYRLRIGDRISLGKGELITFIFKMN
ncbi:MAG TPA: FHA domain-containing protein [Stenomitos sp.]